MTIDSTTTPPAELRPPGGAPSPSTELSDARAATKETLEDYTLRFAPRSYRRWGPGVVATSALGGIAYLADFSIGANIGIANALLGIAVAALIIFVTGFPLAYYAARYNIDLDLITRGSDFGYYGSVITNVIFATFTFIFFALEGSIMAQGLEIGLGRIVFVIVNLVIALVLMEADMFSFLNTILGFYANCAMAWIVTVATDIIVNKYWLKLSPKQPEFRRGMLYDWNPVGVVSVLLSAGVSIAFFFGAFGPGVQPFSPIFAILIALVATPLMAIATHGRYYLRRSDDGIDAPMLDADGNPSAEKYLCHVSGIEFERPDMLMSAEPGPHGEKQYISSLALATDKKRRYVLPADPPIV